jgi:hypothetical protein
MDSGGNEQEDSYGRTLIMFVYPRATSDNSQTVNQLAEVERKRKPGRSSATC